MSINKKSFTAVARIRKQQLVNKDNICEFWMSIIYPNKDIMIVVENAETAINQNKNILWFFYI